MSTWASELQVPCREVLARAEEAAVVSECLGVAAAPSRMANGRSGGPEAGAAMSFVLVRFHGPLAWHWQWPNPCHG